MLDDVKQEFKETVQTRVKMKPQIMSRKVFSPKYNTKARTIPLSELTPSCKQVWYDLICHPDSTTQQISSRLNLAQRTIQSYLQVLRRDELVVRKRVGRKVVYRTAGGSHYPTKVVEISIPRNVEKIILTLS